MDIIQGLIDTGNAGRSGWRIVNNGGAIGVLNNRTSNVLFSILNEGIGTSSNVSSSFINSYSGINVSNYTGSGSTGSTGSLWSSNVSGSKIYYNSGNIGIGATDPIAPLHIYNTSNTRLLLDATTTGTASVEFRRGTGADALNDYRFINDSNGSLKLQYENTTQSFGNTIADLAWFSSNDTIIHKNTSFNGRVGIGTVYHTTRSLDVLGDTNVSGTVSVGGLSVSGVSSGSGVSGSSNAVLTNSITSNTSFTIHNGFTPNPTSSSINLIRGTTADTNHDYKVGNFNGEFKVISSVSSVDTDYIRITTAGAITNPSGTANWNIGSDRRIKENIKRASYDKCLENINRLELNCFNYVEGFNTVNRDKTQLGFIAQEVSAIFPKSISTQGYYSDTLSIPDLLSIDISQINYALYGAVKKLIEKNDEDQESILLTIRHPNLSAFPVSINPCIISILLSYILLSYNNIQKRKVYKEPPCPLSLYTRRRRGL
jgi:hypothetical protein